MRTVGHWSGLGTRPIHQLDQCCGVLLVSTPAATTSSTYEHITYLLKILIHLSRQKIFENLYIYSISCSKFLLYITLRIIIIWGVKFLCLTRIRESDSKPQDGSGTNQKIQCSFPRLHQFKVLWTKYCSSFENETEIRQKWKELCNIQH
jgi:hypothetical protein